MSSDYASIQVWSDHAIPVGEPGEDITVSVVSGDTVYYGDRQVTSGSALGSLTVGQSTVVSVPANWLRSASSSSVQLTGVSQGVPLSQMPPSVVSGASLGTTATQPTSAGRETLGAVNHGALVTWQGNLANRDQHVLDVAALGDSTVEGQGVASVSQRWLARLATMLTGAFQIGGVPIDDPAQPLYIPAYYISGTLPAPFTFSGSPTQRVDWGPGGRSLGLVTGQSASITVHGTSFDVVTAAQAGGSSITVTVDGGGPQTISTSQGSGTSDYQLTRIAFANRGQHTIVVAGNSVTTAIFDGINVYDGNESAGIRLHDMGHSGQTTAGMLVAPAPFNGYVAALNAINPALVILMVGCNDYAATTPVIPSSQTQANITALIAMIRGAVSGRNVSIVVVGQWTRNNTSGSGEPWSNYIAAIRAAVNADSTGWSMFIDMTQRMPPVASDPSTVLYTDTVHPSAGGYQAVADIIYSELRQGQGGIDMNAIQTYVNQLDSYVGHQVSIDPCFPVTTSGAWSVQVNTVNTKYQQFLSAGAQNNSVTYAAKLGAGTYTLFIQSSTAVNRGIYTVLLDGQAVGTADSYAASTGFAQLSVTGIVVPQTGVHTITLFAATRNASNTTGYYLGPSWLGLVKTA